MTALRVTKNPACAVDGKLVVIHPDTRRAFPEGVFDLSEADRANPRVRRLFAPQNAVLPPGYTGLMGGVYGDLLVVTGETTKKESK